MLFVHYKKRKNEREKERGSRKKPNILVYSDNPTSKSQRGVLEIIILSIRQIRRKLKDNFSTYLMNHTIRIYSKIGSVVHSVRK